MSYEMRCPSCGKKQFSYEARDRRFGKVTKECKHCGAVYLDPRYHELAVEGIPKDEFGIGQFLLVMAIGGLILWRGRALFDMHQLGTPDEMQKFLPIAFMVIGALCIIGGIFEIVSIKTGLKQKRFQKKLKESEERLQNGGYKYTLEKLGYLKRDMSWDTRTDSGSEQQTEGDIQ